MLLLNGQIQWRGISTTVVVELIILLALALAAVSYVEWSSKVAVAEFMSATESSASDPNHSSESPVQAQSRKGSTGCPVGKRSLPTQLAPLP
ncbi:hypothetical protein CQ12_20915 [Bradyrhizobium jicamae]|uniref:Uncharacterized protein n=1 Tax=Bradyrhizobium jicamae TaxID=280332 RepID=A0A0R3KEG0_9BRAD|nr:hypothetical protein [Bradyrhizobium jicamae]KRQ94070.1 hypothetical protein CQ12_20915 [Bradyrhizobium jicamae]